MLTPVDDDGERIVDDYPGDTAVVFGAFYDKETNELEPWRSIPRNVDLSLYMCVVPGKRRGSAIREYRVLYSPAIRPHTKPNCPWSVTVSLYGFLDSMNLSVTGNWDKCVQMPDLCTFTPSNRSRLLSTLKGAPKALQWIKLTGGRLCEPFKSQGLALSDLEQHIIGTVRGCGLPFDDKDAMVRYRQRELKVGRRVFDKVRTNISQSAVSRTNSRRPQVTANTPPSIYPAGPATAISDKWRITSAPKLGYRQTDMQVKACNAASFSPGDFVQVVVKVLALVQPGKYNAPATATVRFDLLSCIRLVSSNDVSEVRESHRLVEQCTILTLIRRGCPWQL